MRNRKVYTIMSAKGTTGIGNIIDVKDFRNVVVSVATASSANFTLKCQGAIGDTNPTFTSAASATNAWGYLELATLADSSAPVRGATGVTSAGTDICQLYEVNINGVDWLTFNITAISAGTITVTVTCVDNV